MCGARWPHRDLPQDLCPVYRPGEWEQLPSERDLNPFSRYEALDPKRPIILDDIESTLSETGKILSFGAAIGDPLPQMVATLVYVFGLK